MTDKLFSLFKKKKDGQFKNAGPGHRLNEPSKRDQSSKSEDVITVRIPPSDDARQAGIAALSRFATNTSSHSTNLSVSAMRDLAITNTSCTDIPAPANRTPETLAVTGVYFKCPLLGHEILSKEEWISKIRDFLKEQLNIEQEATSCLMIHSLNKPRERVESCVNTLYTYLENIAKNPHIPKYRKIRANNRIFMEKVAKIEGANEFLAAAGFTNQEIDGEDYLIMLDDPDVGRLENLMDLIKRGEAIIPQIDRNLQLLKPAEAVIRINFPNDFYILSSGEIKKEQQNRTDQVENMMALKTKAMREREELREMKKYKYAIIRIKFPDNTLLQGTFGALEKFSSVVEFVTENILNSFKEFTLKSSMGTTFSEENYSSTLFHLKLVPTSVLIFHCVQDHMEASCSYLKPEIMFHLRDL